MLPPPDKQDLELEVDGFFRNGDKKDVARLVQRDSSTVSRQLSPNCDHNNHVVYWFLLCLWAFDNIRQDLGDAVINLVLRERAKWLNEAPSAIEHPAKLTSKVGQELVEAIEAEMSGHALDDQIQEWTDVVTAAAKKQQDLINKRASGFNGHNISTETRDMVKESMKGGK